MHPQPSEKTYVTAAGAALATAAGLVSLLALRHRDSDVQHGSTLSSRSLSAPKFRGTAVDIPNVVLTDDRGIRRRLFSDIIFGRSVCVNFFYTQCNGLCPGTTMAIHRVRKKIKDYFARDELVFLSISLDASEDTPERLAKYRAAYGIPVDDSLPEWLFCSCPEEHLEEIRRSFGVFDPDPAVDSDRSQHAATLTFGNESRGRWSALPSGMRVDQIVSTMCRILGNSERQRYAALLADRALYTTRSSVGQTPNALKTQMR
jgi:cytochrome oxidase Cu insertion factor (SCO1/SenC/PrrC family)